MGDSRSRFSTRDNFRRFFIRGLGILLPTVLTIWLLIAVYQFVSGYIAQPINAGIKILAIEATPWPRVDTSPTALTVYEQKLASSGSAEAREGYANASNPDAWLVRWVREQQLRRWWGRYALFMDMIGLVVAIVLIYMAGLLLGSFIGRRLHQRGEDLLHRLPIVRRVYPSVKQVTDFFVGEKKAENAFNRVVAIEYPRRGIWSIGLVTGQTMQGIQDGAGVDCITIFVPSSPTPFTGYVITVPKADTIELPITIEDALKFAVSGGVLIPPHQKVDEAVPPTVKTPEPYPKTVVRSTASEDDGEDPAASGASASGSPQTP